MFLTGLIFFVVYAVLAIGSVPGFRIDRTGAALIGATLMIVVGSITFEQAYQAIDYRTLILLFGMMVVVANLRLSGFFRLVGAKIIEHAKSPHQLLGAVILTSGLLSAFFVNDTVCLVLTPLLLAVCNEIGCSPLPYLIALATSSNIGSVATITGNPQNMLIGTFSHLHYRDFAASLAPVAILGLIIDFILISLIFRSMLHWPKRESAVHPRIRVHRAILIKSLTASIVMIIFFFAGADISLVALAAGASILITRRVKPQKIYREIDWELLTLFAGLFVVVGAVENSGLAHEFFVWAGEDRMQKLPYLAGIITVLSNTVSNVPAVLILKSFIPQLSDPRKGWLLLAMASTLAGNLTMLGSIANLIVVQGARYEIKIRFMDFLKVGIPLTIITILIGILFLL